MRNILFIAYYFPPTGGGGVQRSVKFVKYLPTFGFNPLVLTTTPSEETRWSPRDEELLNSFPPNVIIRRIHCVPPEFESKRRRRFRTFLGMSSQFGHSWEKAITEEGTKICVEHKPDLIFVTMSPFYGTRAASELSKRFRIPWVADLRDPWALDEMQVYLSGFHHRLAKHRMRKALSDAAMVIMNTPTAASKLRKTFPEYRDKNVVSLTNGYDRDDFPLTYHEFNKNEIYTILHSGSLHTAHGYQWNKRRKLAESTGRITPGVDFLTRSHVFLIKAMERWFAEDPTVRNQVSLKLIGTLTKEDQSVVTNSSVKSIVKFLGYQSHKETVFLQQRSDLLFLPMHNLPSGNRATIVPGKTYEYMATGNPILAPLPEGDARDFLDKAGTGLLCQPDDVSGMVNILKSQFKKWKAGRMGVFPDREYISNFERRLLTERLSLKLDNICNGDHIYFPENVFVTS